MHAVLAAELAVVVDDRVQRHVTIRHVVSQDGRKQDDVVCRVAGGRLAFQGFEFALQASEELGRPPWHQPLRVNELPAEFLHRIGVITRQPLNGYGPNASWSMSRK